ncbi:phytoene desaturase [Deinococcus metallilatus]|uniref:Phytoene desaturase n=1 Tax=Deinococcus metallilatus TaxID=1211322 RepID=A0AAJ5JZ04_9DEIO|nr:phytoene desaturase family protein [Deinococcus metallilatus]MBB5294856.1 phytoene desaturase [Deinococcus metallilatus]QBY09428.1 phytoene desaturase [Deinococcus metallilatus]RXJ09433.1 phytoene desaturase [Deinococcus metallilatus]TLK28956.1 phytoene desaturase [Deinococcus metallilatus]GMA16783.1 phytoene dehydrogenase [Deinococcus metallilatus]
MPHSLPSRRKQALIIGSGFGGLSLGIRLQSLGFDTTILEKLDGPGGRAYQKRTPDGYVFDMGPTVITVPHFIEELFALERDQGWPGQPDYPEHVLTGERVRAGESGGPRTRDYVQLVPILPFYRISFDDGTFFDYDGDPDSTRRQIAELAPGDLAGYERFHADAEAIFRRGFLELGYTHFGDVSTMLRVVPDLLKLDAVRTLFSFTSKYFRSPKLRQVFSFETLLIGGNPLSVPAIYAMIHFVEKTWGVHYALGGTGALVRALGRKFEELGGRIEYGAEVEQILVTDEWGRPVRSPFGQRVARGVRLRGGEERPADLVVSNGDWANTYLKRVPPQARLVNSDLRVKAARQSMSLLVIYFGFRDDGRPLNLRHHNIILGPRYEALLREIFGQKVLGTDFSQYLHVPTLTDPSLAPPGHHAAYTLIPVPHNGSGIDWEVEGPKLVERVLALLEERGHIPGLRARLAHLEYITPDHFEGTLDSYLGNAFGPEPTLIQSAYFRPHNRSEDVQNLYLVGAGVQPGAGTPSVMMSAKMTARLIAQDFGLQEAVRGAEPDRR